MNGKHAADFMTHPVITVEPDALVLDAIRLLLHHQLSGLPVVSRDGEMIGIITEHDIMNLALSGNAADTLVQEAMTQPVVSLPPEAGIDDVIDCLSTRRLRRVPIVQSGGVVGIVSRRDILREMLNMYGKYH